MKIPESDLASLVMTRSYGLGSAVCSGRPGRSWPAPAGGVWGSCGGELTAWDRGLKTMSEAAQSKTKIETARDRDRIRMRLLLPDGCNLSSAVGDAPV